MVRIIDLIIIMLDFIYLNECCFFLDGFFGRGFFGFLEFVSFFFEIGFKFDVFFFFFCLVVEFYVWKVGLLF